MKAWTVCVVVLSALVAVPTSGVPILPPHGLEANLFSDTGHAPAPELFQDSALRSVGRLYYSGETQCTATLVAPDVIITAAHCVEDRKGIMLNSDMEFLTGSSTESGGDRFKIDPAQVTVGTSDYMVETNYDVAFLRLRTSADPSRFTPATLAPLSSSPTSEKKYLTGYFHRAGSILDNSPTTEPCEVVSPLPYATKPPEDYFTYNCGSTEGMSGAPYYAKRNGRIVILGVHRGELNGNREHALIPFSPNMAGKAADGYAAMQVMAAFHRDHN